MRPSTLLLCFGFALDVSAADLPELKTKGVLKVIAQKDEAPEMFSFAAKGAPGFEREMIEGFARLHDLKVETLAVKTSDERIPALLRLIPPVLVLYLALPIDLIPDFIPVIGQIDDILVVAVGVALLVRLAPMRVFDEHLLELEAIDAAVRDVTEPPRALPGPDRPA